MNKSYERLEKLIVLTLIIIFYLYNYDRIDYGLPFFINLDESEFTYSSLSYLTLITGYQRGLGDPMYAPLINLILILNYIFINELVLNSLNIQEIISKIYFNPELFIMYGRLASLTVTSLSIFVLYLIFKKLKIKLFLLSLLLVSFTTSLYSLDISTINGKNSFYLFFFLFQLYFFLKYLLKINKFNIKSYIYIGIIGSLAWGINYWPAIVSIYSVFILHLKKFKFQHLNYLLTFLIIFFIFGPLLNLLVSNQDVMIFFDSNKSSFEIVPFVNNALIKMFDGLIILIKSEKNIYLLLIFFPFYLMSKGTKYKKEFLIISLLIFEPILIFAIADGIVVQLRYFVGSISVILILTALIFNEFSKTNLKYLSFIFIIFNFYIIFNNITLNNKINNIISRGHSFYEFNKEINIDRSKILYLIDLGFQESLEQNLLYIKLYENDNLIKKNDRQNRYMQVIKNKIKKINNTKNILINEFEIKENITYFNYTYLEINDYKLFFDFIKKDFDYVIIEESIPFYLNNREVQKKIKSYVKKNFVLEKKQFYEDKIFLRSFRSIIHYYNDTINSYDLSENINNSTLEKIFGNNYALYNLKK